MKKFKLILWWLKVNYIQLCFIFFVGYFILFQFVIRGLFGF